MCLSLCSQFPLYFILLLELVLLAPARCWLSLLIAMPPDPGQPGASLLLPAEPWFCPVLCVSEKRDERSSQQLVP